MRRLPLEAVSSLARQAAAELRKIAAARMTLAFLLALPLGTYLFAFDLYHVERAADRLPVPNVLHAITLLFFASWKSLLFQTAALARFTAEASPSRSPSPGSRWRPRRSGAPWARGSSRR